MLQSLLGSSGQRNRLQTDFSEFSIIAELSFTGVLLVSLADNMPPKRGTPSPIPTTPTALLSHTSANPLLGDILAVASAVGYAIYVILLKVSSLS